MSRPVYFIFDGWYYKIIGTILAFVGVFVVIPILLLPQTTASDKHTKEVLNRIDQGDIDYTFGDVSELASCFTTNEQGEKYKGKIVSFTCIVSYIGEETYDDCHPGMSLESEKTGRILANCRVAIPNKTRYSTVGELKAQFNEGDEITVIGEVAGGGGGYGALNIDNCKVVKCS